MKKKTVLTHSVRNLYKFKKKNKLQESEKKEVEDKITKALEIEMEEFIEMGIKIKR